MKTNSISENYYFWCPKKRDCYLENNLNNKLLANNHDLMPIRSSITCFFMAGGEKGIDLYRPYNKPTILPGGTEMGFKKNCILAGASSRFFPETVILFV
jgi:hypothetical protein